MKPNIPDLNIKLYYDLEEEENGEIVKMVENLTSSKAQAGKLLFDLKVEIFARVSCFQYWKLNLLNKQFSQLLQSREIFRVRRKRRLAQPYVFMCSSGEICWTMFDKDFKNFRKLVTIASYMEIKKHYCTHLMVIGREVQCLVVWQYKIEKNNWIKDTEMITPRVTYASASRGADVFFAGVNKTSKNGIPCVVNVAERYNSNTKTLKSMSAMHKRRKFSSRCILRGKFYVLGCRKENYIHQTCGESYDEMTDSWKLIPDMLKGMTFMFFQYPPLITVVNDNLYLLETWLNELWVYDINANTWKNLGVVTMKANDVFGWGVAFKSLGDRLFVIEGSSAQSRNGKMSVSTCRPSPKVEEMVWEENEHCCDGVQLSHFIHNCCVMFA